MGAIQKTEVDCLEFPMTLGGHLQWNLDIKELL